MNKNSNYKGYDILLENTLSLCNVFLDEWIRKLQIIQKTAPVGTDIIFTIENEAYMIGNYYLPGHSTLKISKMQLDLLSDQVEIYRSYFKYKYPKSFLGICRDLEFEVKASPAETISILNTIKQEISGHE